MPSKHHCVSAHLKQRASQQTQDLTRTDNMPHSLNEMLKGYSLRGPLRIAIQGLVLLTGDLLAFIVAAVFSTLLVHQQGVLFNSYLNESFQYNQRDVYALFVLGWLFWFGFVKQVYTRRKPFWTELWRTLLSVIAFAVFNAALSSVIAIRFSTTWWSITWFSLLFLLPTARHICRLLLCSANMWRIPTLIIGNGDNAREAYLALKSEPAMGFEVEAFGMFLNEADRRSSVRMASPVVGLPITSLSRDSQEFMQLQPYHCVIALEAEQREQRDTVIRLLNHHKINDVHVIPAMRGVPLYGMETAHFFRHEVLLIQLRNNLANPIHRASKRIFDIVGSLTLLTLLCPLFALLAYKVSKDGGKPFFGHVRIGQHNKSFKCYKFRSMVVNAEEVLKHLLATDPVAQAEWEEDFKLKNDPRVSPLGETLRRTSLDELPQLLNVLKGEMSLVGPRPVMQEELARYGEDVDYYLMAKPGMTGLWQVSGRNDVDYATRVYLDSWYVKNWSLWSDIAILFKTISVVINRSGAY